MGEPERRRRRLRPSAHPAPAAAPPAGPAGTEPAAGDPPAAVPAAADPPASAAPPEGAVAGAVTSAVTDEVTVRPSPADLPGRPAARPAPSGNGRPPAGARPAGNGEDAERGLRGLVGSGSSQVGVGAALRARDSARPTEAHLADAEANLVIVRRNWLPREDLPRNR